MEKKDAFCRYRFVGAVFLFLFSSLFLGSLFVYAGGVRGVTDDTIDIGVILAQTGPVADTTVPITEGIRNYFQYINEQGGIYNRKVKLIVEDDRYTIPLAMAAFKKLIFRDEVLTILGMGGSGQTKAFYHSIEKNRVPGIIISLAEDMIKPCKRYLFIPCATYEDEIKVIFKYLIEDLRVINPRIGFINLDIEYGKIGRAAAVKTAESYGIKMVAMEIINLAATEATTQVLAMKKAKVNHVILQTSNVTAAAFLRSAKMLDFNSNFIGTYYVCDDDVVRIAGDAARNLIGVHSFASWHEDAEGVAQMRGITLRYKPGTEKPMRNKFYTQGWAIALICAEGLKKAGRDLTIEGFVDGIENIRNLDTAGITAPITYSSTKHKPSDACKMYKADIANKRVVPISGWLTPKE
ncbi:MAG: ABC transporter substrate-binding protein [Thermodesulfobacteriota bacterium]